MYPFRWVPTRALDSVKPFRKVWVGVFAACYPGRWCLLLACFKNVHCSLWFLRRCVKCGLCSISSIAKKSAVVIHLLLYPVYCILYNLCIDLFRSNENTLTIYAKHDQVVWSQSVFFFSPDFDIPRISVVRILLHPWNLTEFAPWKWMLLGRRSKILLGFGPCSHLLYVKFPGNLYIQSSTCCGMWFFFFFLGNGPVDVKVDPVIFSAWEEESLFPELWPWASSTGLDVLILYIKVFWFLKTDGCHFGISYWYPILELTVIFASKVRNPWGYQKSGILQSSVKMLGVRLNRDMLFGAAIGGTPQKGGTRWARRLVISRGYGAPINGRN